MSKVSGSHLTQSDRGAIDGYLQEGRSIRFIANMLHCAPSTISREIKNHAITKIPVRCDCIEFGICKKQKVCNPSSSNPCKKMCRTCSIAKKMCSDYVQAFCEDQLENKTGVCNACTHKRNCHFTHQIYDPEKAQQEAETTLRLSRSGFDVTEEQLRRIDEIVTPLIAKGQSIYHILQEHRDELDVSETTLRRMVNGCILGARRIDLREAVKRKPRRKRQDTSYKTMKTIKAGRLYSDFLEYISKNDVSVVQMDCVEGNKTDKEALLTLHFQDIHLQIALLMKEQTAAEVVVALDKLETILGTELFRECFPLILTDNGHEFSDIEGMERSINDGTRTMIFFCEPNRSDEKGACENNHKYIRYICPKGSSFQNLTQEDVNIMMDHINSYARRSLHGKTPYQFGKILLPEDFFLSLKLTEIPADEVHLKPDLFRLIHSK